MDGMTLSFSWSTVWLLLGWLTAAIWLVKLVPFVRAIIFPRLPPPAEADAFAGRGWPSVAVIVPARNEEVMIRHTVESLLALDYPALKIILVDDRSTDRTGAIMDELAQANPQLDVVHVRELPPGWLGKNHANWLGATRSQSDWLLFTDGDILFAPDVMRRAVCYAEREKLDHLTMIPGLLRAGFFENLTVCTFGFLFSMRFRPWTIRHSRNPNRYVGVGAFNLVRRSAYNLIGKHERLALEIVDDLKLGKLIRQHGLNQDALNGGRTLRVRWQVGVSGVARGMEKNAFASYDYSLLKMTGGLLWFGTVIFTPYLAAPLLDCPSSWGWWTTLFSLHTSFAILLVGAGLNPLGTVFLPVTCLIFVWIVLRSAWITLAQGGVTWRDTHYPLAELRKGLV